GRSWVPGPRWLGPALAVAGWFLAGRRVLDLRLQRAADALLLGVLVAFLEEFRWSRAETSLAFSMSALVGGVSAPLVGALVDPLGPRRLVLLGGSVLTLGLLGSAYVGALWQIVVLYGALMTLGANCLGLVVFVPF